jgi:uroporphyrinogen-III synthase
MSMPLYGLTVALAEGRQLEELAQMLEKEGAKAFRCPMVSILDAPDSTPVLMWLDELTAGRFDYLVLLTGEGVRRLLGFADRAGRRQEVVEALGRSQTVTRGPKPARALKEIGLAPSLVAEAPTTDGVIATLKRETLQGKTVGVQLYSEENPPLLQFLASAGATPRTVLPYVYAPAADAEKVADLIRQLAAGTVQVIAFTSSPQVDRLYEVASECKLEEALRQGLERACVAAVGPIVADNLRSRGAPVHVCPEQGFVMKNLVQQLVRRLA